MLKIEELKRNVSYKRLYNFSFPDSFKIKSFSLDTRKIKPGEVFIALKGKNFDGHDFIDLAWKKGAVLVIAERVPLSSKGKPFMIVEDTLKTLGDIAALLRRKYNPVVIGITGSVGKTTIKDMLFFILKDKFNVWHSPRSFNNFIGLPQTLLGLKPKHKICILELGTNHKGEIRRLSHIAYPEIAVISNISETHTAFLGSKRGVWKEKLSIFSSNPNMIGVLNGDDVFLKKATIKNRCIFYGQNKNNHFFAEFIKKKGSYLWFVVNNKYSLRLQTLGVFNIYNALAAISVSRLLGVSIAEAVKKLSKFQFPPSRLQIKKRSGFIIIDDAYNSNPLSLKDALESLNSFLPARRRIGIIADMLELGKKSKLLHLSCREAVEKAGFEHLIFLGKYTKYLAAELVRRGFDPQRIHFASDFRKASDILRRIVKKGDVVFIKGSHAFNLDKISRHFRISKFT